MNDLTTLISSTDPDWSREAVGFFEWSPGKKLLRSIRDYQRYKKTSTFFSPWLRRWAVFRYLFWSAVSGADIPLNCQIEGGLLLPHPNGVVIHPSVRIGPNCLIFQQVTLGTRDGPEAPILKGHVDVGAGAKILGGVLIGEHAQIGANAVVTIDVPAQAVAVGIPATIRQVKPL